MKMKLRKCCELPWKTDFHVVPCVFSTTTTQPVFTRIHLRLLFTLTIHANQTIKMSSTPFSFAIAQTCTPKDDAFNFKKLSALMDTFSSTLFGEIEGKADMSLNDFKGHLASAIEKVYIIPAAEKASGKKKRGDGKPRASNAYMLWSNEHRASFQAANSKATAVEIAKLMGAAWANMSDADKAPYVQKYEQAKAELKEALDNGTYVKPEKKKAPKKAKSDDDTDTESVSSAISSPSTSIKSPSTSHKSDKSTSDKSKSSSTKTTSSTSATPAPSNQSSSGKKAKK